MRRDRISDAAVAIKAKAKAKGKAGPGKASPAIKKFPAIAPDWESRDWGEAAIVEYLPWGIRVFTDTYN